LSVIEQAGRSQSSAKKSVFVTVLKVVISVGSVKAGLKLLCLKKTLKNFFNQKLYFSKESSNAKKLDSSSSLLH